MEHGQKKFCCGSLNVSAILMEKCDTCVAISQTLKHKITTKKHSFQFLIALFIGI